MIKNNLDNTLNIKGGLMSKDGVRIESHNGSEWHKWDLHIHIL